MGSASRATSVLSCRDGLTAMGIERDLRLWRDSEIEVFNPEGGSTARCSSDLAFGPLPTRLWIKKFDSPLRPFARGGRLCDRRGGAQLSRRHDRNQHLTGFDFSARLGDRSF